MLVSNKKYFILVLVLIGLLSFVSCKKPGVNKTERAFYYWRSNFNLSDKDVAYLKDAGIHKIYLHFFDVARNDQYNRVLPVDEINFETAPMDTFQYVPVVYLANKALEVTPADSIDRLSKHILDEVEHIALLHKVEYKELQFDCDWTEATKQKYFELLTFIHQELKQTDKILSATIRLHQVKYADKTGIPPVDRGMLMFYNMGQVNTVAGYNSIYNSKDADKYTAFIEDYRLPLDVALPIFSWAICIRQGRVTGIIEKSGCKDFTDTSQFKPSGNNIFVAHGSFFFHGKYFMKNDTVKMEQITPDVCKNAADNVRRYLKDEIRTVSLFDYDSLYLSTYEKQDLEKIFTPSY